MARKTLAEKFKEYRLLIFNSSKPEILPSLESYGMDKEHLTKGEELYNVVQDLTEKQKLEQQEESQAYDTFYESKEECENNLRKTQKIIKMASRSDKNLQNRLKVNDSKERKIEEWIKQSIEFYNLVLNEQSFLTSIAKYSLTPEKLTAQKTQLNSLKDLRNKAMSEKGQAQEATRLRNEKMEELEDYCYELRTLATIALEDTPQLLEELGILVR
ncbi:MAG: hypothetical protein JEZ05_10770 [Tenericutes bacterium]|nr:hypothetical protein [Mycoplasmatota bacterium]